MRDLTGGGAPRRATFAEIARNAERLASALAGLGVREGDRVATFCWNNQEHLEAYFAVPAMGAVLHTLNIRLFPEQLSHIVNHADDRIVIVDDSLVPLLARVVRELPPSRRSWSSARATPRRWRATAPPSCATTSSSPPRSPAAWPEVDERSAASMCYTSGTTGDPKGVVYSHRSTFLHAMAVQSASLIGITEADRVLTIVPMFHVNAWGLPYGAFLSGATLHMPGPFMQPEHLTAFIAQERSTLASAVPTIWNGILTLGEQRRSTCRPCARGPRAAPPRPASCWSGSSSGTACASSRAGA